MFNIRVNDELGQHILESDRDCVFKCHVCGKEIDVLKEHLNIKDRTINAPNCPDCNNKMKFHYWLDSVYTEDEYKELEKNKSEVIINE